MNFNFSANLGASDAGNLDAGELPTSNEIHVRAQEELKRYNVHLQFIFAYCTQYKMYEHVQHIHNKIRAWRYIIHNQNYTCNAKHCDYEQDN